VILSLDYSCNSLLQDSTSLSKFNVSVPTDCGKQINNRKRTELLSFIDSLTNDEVPATGFF